MTAIPTLFLRALANVDMKHAERWTALAWWYHREGRSVECTPGRITEDMFAAGYAKPNSTTVADTLAKDRRLTRLAGKQKAYSVKVTSQAGLDSRFVEYLEPGGVPQSLATASAGASPAASIAAARVFVVHGHDHGFKNTVARFLETLELGAVILHEKPDGGRTVIEKFEEEGDVGFAVVLATPDDLGRSKRDAKANLTEADRARQNVIFELGYFIGKLGRGRVALITERTVELPSDLSGVVYIDRKGWQTRLYDALCHVGHRFDQEKTRKALAIHG